MDGRRARSRAVKPALRFLGRRLLWALVVVLGVGTAAFFMARALPGDPVRMMLGPQARPADVAQARAIYGLDRPLGVQYLRFWQRLVHLRRDRAPAPEHESCAPLGPLHVDLGYSFRYRQPVATLLAEKAPRSFELALAAMLLQVSIGLGVGILAARRRGSLTDQLAVGATLVGVSAPTFVLGVVLQYVLAYRLGWLPYDGYGLTGAEHLRSLVLPALTLAIFGSAMYARLCRDELGAALAADFVRTARGKGASEARVLVVHALRGALVPIATLVVLDFGTLIGGAIVTERLFRWPGMGYLAVDALVNRDGPVVFGTVLFSAAAIVLASLALDLLYVLLDPRLRRPGQAEPS
ncbi:MAG: ABC transporter permease [Deltaproteobacteria bacterium]|nr:ABC transporter permease [Deltaproteobacteria bacterium]